MTSTRSSRISRVEPCGLACVTLSIGCQTLSVETSYGFSVVVLTVSNRIVVGLSSV